jgi:NAD(P)H-hydrate epimerase
MENELQKYFQQVKLPLPKSHKGQNGKLLIIGGSELFHAASKWSLDIASRFVDMVFYASVPSNNHLIQKVKGEFWNGIVIDRAEVESYLEEADCILIGPGMTRSSETEELVNTLVKKYPHKKWVIDAGALQMVDVKLLNNHCILTPHTQEFLGLLHRLDPSLTQLPTDYKQLQKLCTKLGGATILYKGQEDLVFNADHLEVVSGGNAGMTKGGTGDVLAGVVAGLYTCSEVLASAVVASVVNKKAGDELFRKVGPFFNASDLVQQIPQTLWQILSAKSV